MPVQQRPQSIIQDTEVDTCSADPIREDLLREDPRKDGLIREDLLREAPLRDGPLRRRRPAVGSLNAARLARAAHTAAVP